MADENLLKELRRSNELLETLVRIQLGPILDKELGDSKSRKIYEMTGTNASVKEIAKSVGISTGSISQTWQRWEKMGVVIRDGRQYRRVLE